MKFELLDPRQQYPDSELIEDLQIVAQKLGKNTLKQREYDKYGKFSYQTMKKRFGSWEKALNLAGLELGKRPWGGELSETRIPEDQLIEDLKRVAEIVSKTSISMNEYEEHGKFGTSAICKRFGGWNNAKKAANLTIGRLYNTTEEAFFENILNVWEKLGRQPKYHEIVSPLSKLNISSYERKFGTWRKALEKFVEYMNSKDDLQEEIIVENRNVGVGLSKEINVLEKNDKAVKPKKRTNRTANYRQRFKVMQRDGFKCVLCGASPVNIPGCVLNVDHIIPWSKGGETVEENLRTLCSACNQGRSNRD